MDGERRAYGLAGSTLLVSHGPFAVHVRRSAGSVFGVRSLGFGGCSQNKGNTLNSKPRTRNAFAVSAERQTINELR